MADARAKAVMSELANLVSQNHFLPEVASTSAREPGFKGDVIEVPSISDLTVIADGNTDTSPESVTTNILSLTADLEPWINAKLPQRSQEQLLNGANNWARGVAEHALGQLQNSISNSFTSYLVKSVVADLSATYVVNPAADTLTSADVLNAKAQLLSANGTLEQNVVLLVHPFGEASIRSISTFVPNYSAAENGSLGIPRMGFVHGVPVFMSNSVQKQRTVACTAVSITSNVATVTVAASHGIEVGMKVTIAGITTPLTTAAAVASVASTSFTVALTDSNGAMADGIGTVTIQACENLMLDKANVHTSIQKMPGSRVVPLYNSTGDALQISSIWGRVGRAGRVVSIHSPPTSA